MAGLFNLVPRTKGEREATFIVDLDPREPYLDHHRPGGDPLLPTVMGIEASVIGAHLVSSHECRATVTDVKVHKPFVLSGEAPSAVGMSIVRLDDEAGSAFQCTLTSAWSGRMSRHLEATVLLEPNTLTLRVPRLPLRAPPVPHRELAPLVNGSQIYELFFHGPAYQVIGEAQFEAGQMRCRLNPGISPSHRYSVAPSAMAPRLIEFALQSAGLLEIATNARMMIPHSIESIDRLLPLDVSSTAVLFANAAYRPGDGTCIDVEIFDDSKRTVLIVAGYRTVTLPFPLPAAGIAKLHAQLHGC